jgi:formylglycine-generating enzyme required for sulfatase activity
MRYLTRNIVAPLLLILWLAVLIAPRQALALEKVITGADGAPMALVPEGEFIMGLKNGEPLSELNPLRKVTLKAYYIDIYEVTNDRYRACIEAKACTLPSWNVDYPPTLHEEGKGWYFDPAMGNYPVVGATWRQAVDYCRWAKKRVPSNAEWEKAARGTDGRMYPWGNEWDGKRANWDDDGKVDGYKKLAPVGSFPAGQSPYGVMDMAGNVREWTDNLVVRGGSWYSRPVTLRTADPGHEFIVERDDDMGFRCVRDVEPEQPSP